MERRRTDQQLTGMAGRESGDGGIRGHHTQFGPVDSNISSQFFPLSEVSASRNCIRPRSKEWVRSRKHDLAYLAEETWPQRLDTRHLQIWHWGAMVHLEGALIDLIR